MRQKLCVLVYLHSVTPHSVRKHKRTAFTHDISRANCSMKLVYNKSFTDTVFKKYH